MKTRNYQRSLVNNWNDIDWNKAESNLADLQYKILKAHRESDMEKEWCYNLNIILDLYWMAQAVCGESRTYGLKRGKA